MSLNFCGCLCFFIIVILLFLITFTVIQHDPAINPLDPVDPGDNGGNPIDPPIFFGPGNEFF